MRLLCERDLRIS